MSTACTVRQARPEDAATLARMRWAFRGEHRPGAGEERPVAAAEDWMRERLGDDGWLAWVAESDDGAVLGHVFLQLVEKIPHPRADNNPIGYVTNFYVDTAARNRGIGAALLEALTGYAREHALDTLVVWPSERSVPLYRRHGFEPPAELLELASPSGGR